MGMIFNTLAALVLADVEARRQDARRFDEQNKQRIEAEDIPAKMDEDLELEQ